MARPILPMRPKPWTPAENMLGGVGAVVVGQFFPSEFTRYGFTALGALLVGLGLYDLWRARRQRHP
jgi:hypothetical protein